jgi:hypothetical protein
MFLQYFTLVHVAISLIGIAAGFGALAGWRAGKLLPGWTSWFIVMTVATSVTGFFFPIHGFTPGLGVGVISLVALIAGDVCDLLPAAGGAVAGSVCDYRDDGAVFKRVRLGGPDVPKNPALQAIAPTQSSPVFGITQAIVLVSFIVLGIGALRRFPMGPSA